MSERAGPAEAGKRGLWGVFSGCVPLLLSNKLRRRETPLPEFTRITNRRVQFQSPPGVMCYPTPRSHYQGNAHTSQPLWVKFDSVPQTSFSLIFLVLVKTCIFCYLTFCWEINYMPWKACCTAPMYTGSILTIKYQKFLIKESDN